MSSAASVHVYTLNLDVTADQHAQNLALLNDHERHRAARFRFERHRTRWAASRAGLRRVLATWCNVSAHELVFDEDARGKPRLRATPSHRDQVAPSTSSITLPQFNLSHSHQRAIVAVSSELAVGCDIEWLGRRTDHDRVAARYFSAAELDEFHAVPKAQRKLAFLLAWTRKEAVIKTTGEGLRASLSAFDVSLTPDEPARVRAYRHDQYGHRTWHLFHRGPVDDYVMAVATTHPFRPDVMFHDHAGHV